MRKLQALSLSVLLLLSASVNAKTLYVNGTTGNDATTYETNTASAPWKTIARAAWGNTTFTSPNASQAAKPGDVVSIAAGIYWEKGDPNGGRFTVSLNPANSGTATSPITFRGEGLVYVRMLAGYRGGMIGCAGRNYVIWDNFQIDDYYGGSTSDTGPVVFTGGAGYCQIINSDIKGHPGSYYYGYPVYTDNYRAISIEPAHHITVRNNFVHGFRGGQNETGVMSYDSNDNLIENNEFVDNGTAVFIKGVHTGATQARNVIRKNVVRNNWSGIRVLSGQDTQVYQNVIYGNSASGLWAGFADSTRTRFLNNTLYNNDRGFSPQGTELIDVRFMGNIVANNRNAHYNWTVGNPSQQNVSYDRNVYYQNDRHAYFESGQTIGLPVWQSTYGMDVNGSGANPMFMDPAAANFRLQSGSTIRSLSLDSLDLNGNGSTTDFIPAGAYVTGNEVIGRASGPLPAAPYPPTGVTVE